MCRFLWINRKSIKVLQHFWDACPQLPSKTSSRMYLPSAQVGLQMSITQSIKVRKTRDSLHCILWPSVTYIPCLTENMQQASIRFQNYYLVSFDTFMELFEPLDKLNLIRQQHVNQTKPFMSYKPEMPFPCTRSKIYFRVKTSPRSLCLLRCFPGYLKDSGQHLPL